MAKEKQAEKFCRCIKQVRKSVKLRKGQKGSKAREGAAIAICTKSILQTRGRTLKRVRCRGKPKLETQAKNEVA